MIATQRLFLVGLNHATAPLDVRERLAFNSTQRALALAALRRQFPNAEAVLLSTCNRIELYIARAVHEQPRKEEIVDFFSTYHALPRDHFRNCLYEKSDRDAAAHLFSVASSLDSLVLGETQILGQVREAYDAACSAATVGTLLNPLFQRAISTGRTVMSQTTLGDGRLSVASVAVDYATKIFDRFSDKTILSIGAGKMAMLVLQHLSALSPGKLLICNRDGAKAGHLAGKFNGQAVDFEQLSQSLVAADIVVSSTGSAHPIITRKLFEGLRKARRYRPIFMIDIAMPRDIEQSVGDVENVYLYNLDHLQQVVSATQSRRKDAIDAARKIIDAELADFLKSLRSRELGPMIDALYRRGHQLAAEEVSRAINKLPNVSEAERAHLENLARRIVNKLLHDPVQMLRQSDSLHGPTSQYLHAMEKLFRLGDANSPFPPPAAESAEPEKHQDRGEVVKDISPGDAD